MGAHQLESPEGASQSKQMKKKKKDRATGTHRLERTEEGSSQDRQINGASERHSPAGEH
jgi:hypothetical protein